MDLQFCKMDDFLTSLTTAICLFHEIIFDICLDSLRIRKCQSGTELISAVSCLVLILYNRADQHAASEERICGPPSPE